MLLYRYNCFTSTFQDCNGGLFVHSCFTPTWCKGDFFPLLHSDKITRAQLDPKLLHSVVNCSSFSRCYLICLAVIFQFQQEQISFSFISSSYCQSLIFCCNLHGLGCNFYWFLQKFPPGVLLGSRDRDRLTCTWTICARFDWHKIQSSWWEPAFFCCCWI